MFFSFLLSLLICILVMAKDDNLELLLKEIIQNKHRVRDLLSAESKAEFHTSLPSEHFLGAFANSNLEEQLRSRGLDISDCCQWPWVKCVDGIPIELQFIGDFYASRVDLGRLPRTLKIIKILGGKIDGIIDFSGLPPGLELISLSYMKIAGVSNFNHLPQTLKNIILGECEIGGNLDFSAPLPTNLMSIELRRNKLSGNINLHGLKGSNARLFIDFEGATADFEKNCKKALQEAGVEEQRDILPDME